MKPWLTILALISMIGMGACSLIKYSNKTKDVPVYIHDTTVKYLPPQIDTQTVYHSDTVTSIDTIPYVLSKSDSAMMGTIYKTIVKTNTIHDTVIRIEVDESQTQQAEDSATMWKGMYTENQITNSNLKHINSDLIWAIVCTSLFLLLVILGILFYYKKS
jgi:hypothetical protein